VAIALCRASVWNEVPVVIVALLSATPSEAQSPAAALPLAAEVVASIECKYGEDQVGNESKGAGILIGRKRDSIFAVTALHVVQPGDPNCIAPRILVVVQNPFAMFNMTLIGRADQQDVALLGAKLDSAEKVMRGRRWVRRGPVARGSVFLIGCPVGGECWEDPLEGRLRDRSFLRDSTLWTVQSPLIEDGYSGGPAVSRAGEIIGMTLDYGGQSARVRRWSWIESWLRALGYEVTIPGLDLTPAGWIESGQARSRRGAIGLTVVGLPLPARSGSGERLAPSFGLRVESSGEEEVGFWLSVEHLSLVADDRCVQCRDRRELRGTAGFLFGFGVTFYPRIIVRSKMFKTLHPVFSGGILLGRSEQLVRRDSPGQVNPATGLPIREVFSTGTGPAGGFELGAGFDIPAGGAFRFRSTLRYVNLLGVYSTFGDVSVDKVVLTGGILWSP
jgi:Trypsin-like peptidase domain